MATAIPRNAARFTADEIVRATGGTLVHGAATDATSAVETDTRAVAPGDLFVALRGETHDGHRFLASALAAGAKGLVVERDLDAGLAVPSGVFVVRVPDTLRALGDLALAHRRRLPAKVVAITGSVGKTTTKDLSAAALGGLGLRVHRTEGNLNNLVGLPRTLLATPPDADVVVAELGMNVPGEIARLAEIAAPDVGLVTSVAEAHTEGVGDLSGVAREKGALLLALGEGATAIATADDVPIAPYLSRSPARAKLTFGRDEAASVRVASRALRATGATVVCSIGSQRLDLELRLVGEGAAKNAAAAIALVLALRGPAALPAAARALSAVRAPAGRMDLGPGAFGIFLLDDSYNASPRAMENALEAAAEVAKGSGGRLVAVLGDMLELGALEEELHARVGETVARVGTSLFVACGPRMHAAAEDARELGADLVMEVADASEAIEPVRTFVRAGDVVLVKGSRGMRMERVVEALRKSAEPPAAASTNGGAHGGPSGERGAA